MTDPVDAIAIAVAKLEVAKNAVADAESQLDGLLSELKSAPRAEKMGISETLERALGTLRVARTNMNAAEEVLASARK
ncbi:hypothetical protein BH09MYX1_BH09MYX1_58320 [soil metagenome]